MPTPTEQLLTRTVYATDGVTTNWDFSFSGGYLDKAHVKAYTEAATGERVDLTVLESMLIGPYQLQLTPALASGLTLTIYRDTPKNLPLVDFTDESGFSELALDTNAKQAVFIAAETVDTVNTSSSYDAEQAASLAATSAATAVAAQAAASAAATAAAASAVSADASADAALVSEGNAAALATTVFNANTTAFTRTLLADTTSATARSTLGAAAAGDNLDITSIAAHPVGKMIAQIQTFQTGAVATGATTIPQDDTIPQSSEGDQYMSLAFTPQNAASLLVIDVQFNASHSAANAFVVALFQDSGANAIAVSDQYQGTGVAMTQVVLKHIMTAGTTSLTTFKIRAGGVGAGTLSFNGQSGIRVFGGISTSRITITEYLP